MSETITALQIRLLTSGRFCIDDTMPIERRRAAEDLMNKGYATRQAVEGGSVGYNCYMYTMTETGKTALQESIT